MHFSFECFSHDFLEIRADVGKRTVIHPESARYHTKLREPKPLIEMARMDIAFDDGVELEHAESVRLGLGEAVKHELFADVHFANPSRR